MLEMSDKVLFIGADSKVGMQPQYTFLDILIEYKCSKRNRAKKFLLGRQHLLGNPPTNTGSFVSADVDA